MVEIIVVKRNRIVSCRIWWIEYRLENYRMVVIVIVIYGGDMIGIKKNGINNKRVEIIKDLNELVNWIMDCGN